jgi:hypothetical protein
MRKTLLYITILAILGFGIYYFLVREDNSNPYSDAEAGFTIKDTAAIGRIYLADNYGNATLLDRTDSGWVVNKKYKALRSTLELLLATLHDQAPLYPVTEKAHDNVIKSLSADGIKVEVYDRGKKKMRVFYVGGAAVNNSGTNMLMEGAKKPYVVHVQAFNGYLTPRYATQLKDWRDRTVFNMPAEEIKSVSVKYADNPVNSFTINKEGNDISIIADEEIMKGLDGPNTKRAAIYLKYFSNINCEGYLNGLPDMDTTLKTAPKNATIEVTGKHGQHQLVDIYWMALSRRSKNLTVSNPDVPDDYDSDRMYAVINNYSDTVMIQHFVFQPMLRKAYEFFQKDEAAQK